MRPGDRNILPLASTLIKNLYIETHVAVVPEKQELIVPQGVILVELLPTMSHNYVFLLLTHSNVPTIT